MYFVVSGRLDVVVGDQENRVNEMKQGDYFGEASLLSGLPRSASVIASTYCKLYKLSHERLNSVLEIFPDTAKSIQLTTQQAKRKVI